MKVLADHVAVITGASSGIGEAIALELAEQGATLCLLGRNLERLRAVIETVRAMSPRVLSYQVDLTDDEKVRDLTEDLRRDAGSVDILIHSAGVISLGEIKCAPVKDLDWQYRTNVRAPYVLTQALLPMLRPLRGQIVFINSSMGLNVKANSGQYAATKHALKAIADSLRQEVNAEGLRVLNVFLGRTASAMQASVHEIEGRPYHPERLMQPGDVAMVVINALSLPWTAEVTDIHIRPFGDVLTAGPVSFAWNTSPRT
ncbi:MAG: SDR family NAD(P)-dependent oxidoreductase [Candidatus Binatia bacterium]